MFVYRSYSCATPTKFSNPMEYYRSERAKITLEPGWVWIEEQHETGLLAGIEVLKADGALVNRIAVPKLIELAELSKEVAFVQYLKTL